jgi:hypothetical protein
VELLGGERRRGRRLLLEMFFLRLYVFSSLSSINRSESKGNLSEARGIPEGTGVECDDQKERRGNVHMEEAEEEELIS